MTARYEKDLHQQRTKLLKDRLRQDVSAPDFEGVWEDLGDDGLLEEALEDLRADLKPDQVKWLGERKEYLGLLERTQILARRQRRTLERVGDYSGPRPGRPKPEEAEELAPAKLSKYELLCARTYSEYLSIRASKLYDVLVFRAHQLSGTPPTGHESDADMQAAAVTLSPDDALELVRNEEHHERGSGLWLQYATDERAEIFAVEVRWGSLLDVLRRLSDKLADELPWHPADAARWLLTGVPVEVAPIRSRRNRGDDEITVTALPFVDARTVATGYRKMQRRLRGGDNQRVTDKALAVLLFVSERTDRRGIRPGWGTLLKAWNAAHPAWSFKDDRAGFMRRYEAAHKALIGREAPPAWR